MGRNRGAKKLKKGKFNWANRKANRGRKGGMGKLASMPKWKTVRAKMLRNATVIVTPSKAEKAEAAAEVAEAAAKVAEAAAKVAETAAEAAETAN